MKLPKNINSFIGTKNNMYRHYFEMNDLVYRITHYCGGSYCDIVKRLPKNCKQINNIGNSKFFNEARFILTILKSQELAKFAKHFSLEYGVLNEKNKGKK